MKQKRNCCPNAISCRGFYSPISTRRIEQTIRSYRYKAPEANGGGAIDVQATLQTHYPQKAILTNTNG